MTAGSPSRTSIYVAAGRALGAREPDPSVRNPDYLAERFLGDPSKLDLDHPAVHALSLDYEEATKDIEVAGIVRTMIVRTRFVDEALERAVAAGATQVAILGAGFDSHAYRCQELLAATTIFEIDRPSMQAFKRKTVNDVLGGPPANLTYVAIDFQHDHLADVLTRHGYDQARRTFFILEGVTMYLPEEALRRTLRFVAGHPPGSGIVFDFVYRPMVDMIAAIDIAKVPPGANAFVRRFLDLIRDEPWVFGFPVAGEREFLRELGLDLRESLMIGGEESVERYLTKTDGTEVGAQASAQATARAQAAAYSTSGAPQMSPEQVREQRRLMAYQLAEAVVAR